jgi:FixJ family two-component response regulator
VHELGCAGFLEKPFPMEALIRKVEAIFHAREKSDEDDVRTYVEG